MNAYRRRILAEVVHQSQPFAPVANWLDFGSGDGWFASKIKAHGLALNVQPVDVLLRSHVVVAPTLYDGVTLPFDDRTFDVSSAFDVLHHTPDPEASLRELLRCTAGRLILKDHTQRSRSESLVLGVLDEIGNRRFGVPSNYRYQRAFAWELVIRDAGFVRRAHVHPFRAHTGLLGYGTNHLQFFSVWERART